jgi:hypothetical protein
MPIGGMQIRHGESPGRGVLVFATEPWRAYDAPSRAPWFRFSITSIPPHGCQPVEVTGSLPCRPIPPGSESSPVGPHPRMGSSSRPDSSVGPASTWAPMRTTSSGPLTPHVNSARLVPN